MIRYVLAVVLVTSLLAIVFIAADQKAEIRTEQTIDTALTTLEQEAMALSREEDPAADGLDGPQRTVEITLPTDGILQSKVSQLEFERVSGTTTTRVTYRVGDGEAQTRTLDVALVAPDGGTVELGGYTGSVTLLVEKVSQNESQTVIEVTHET